MILDNYIDNTPNNDKWRIFFKRFSHLEHYLVCNNSRNYYLL